VTDDAADEAAYRTHAATLSAAIERALPGWIARCVEVRCIESGRAPDGQVREAASSAGAAAAAQFVPRVRDLLEADPDEQQTTPLALLRDATRHGTAALSSLGVAPVERDEFSQRAFPEDIYDLAPASFGDVDPELVEPGIVWGAAKAHLHLLRRRAEGQR
jgi:hypothetical protein